MCELLNHPYFNLFNKQIEIFSECFEYQELEVELRGIAKAPIKYYKYTKK